MDGIVVGAEDTPAGIAAATWALEEGALRGVPVTVVRAWLDPVALGYGMGMTVVTDLEVFRQSAQDLAQDVLRKAGGQAGGAAATAVGAHGRATEVLCRESEGADLLVVGTRSAGVLARGVLGSVSASVLHHAHCPVVVVPHEQGEPAAPRRVVVGVDHSPSSLHALGWAAQEAALRSWPLVPVLVRDRLDLRPGPAGTGPDLAHLEASERAALTAAAQRHAAGLVVEPEILVGHAAHALLELSRPGDLLVLGARGHGGFRGLVLGSTSTAVAEHAHCPVVVLRPTDPSDGA